MSKPYTDHNNIRIFKHEDIRESDLVWHTDKENRIISIVEGDKIYL